MICISQMFPDEQTVVELKTLWMKPRIHQGYGNAYDLNERAATGCLPTGFKPIPQHTWFHRRTWESVQTLPSQYTA
jgi:hypothetical protein